MSVLNLDNMLFTTSAFYHSFTMTFLVKERPYWMQQLPPSAMRETENKDDMKNRDALIQKFGPISIYGNDTAVMADN